MHILEVERLYDTTAWYYATGSIKCVVCNTEITDIASISLLYGMSMLVYSKSSREAILAGQPRLRPNLVIITNDFKALLCSSSKCEDMYNMTPNIWA